MIVYRFYNKFYKINKIKLKFNKIKLNNSNQNLIL